MTDEKKLKMPNLKLARGRELADKALDDFDKQQREDYLATGISIRSKQDEKQSPDAMTDGIIDRLIELIELRSITDEELISMVSEYHATLREMSRNKRK